MNRPRDGDIYKVIKISNQEFTIKYGYYEEQDRYSKYDEPIPIFPDFINILGIIIINNTIQTVVTITILIPSSKFNIFLLFIYSLRYFYHTNL